MNQILICKNKSIYPIFENPYLDISIDGVFLDDLLDQLYPEKEIKGLVPPFSGWLSNPNDEIILWQRIMPSIGETTILPLLICPDDQDYDCLTIVTKVYRDNNLVYWEDFGFDNSYECMKPELIGTTVDWFTNKNKFIFSLHEYEKAINDLRYGKN